MSQMLYLAGPYTRDDPVANTHRAIHVATAVHDLTGWLPICPHLTLLWHLVDPHEVDYWYDYDLAIIEHCAAIVRLPGPSTGADREMDFATTIGLETVEFTDLPTAAQSAWCNQ